MSERALQRIRRAVTEGRYFFTRHAWEELDSDGLTPYDVETVVLSGRVVCRQRDARGAKYVVEGLTTAGEDATVVVRFAGALVVITVFLGTTWNDPKSA